MVSITWISSLTDRPVLPVISIVITGAVTLVMLSVELGPLSLAAFRSTVTADMLVVAAVVSTVIEYAVSATLTLSAPSVKVAVIEWLPEARLRATST